MRASLLIVGKCQVALTASRVVLLAVAAGFFLELATSDFLPEVRRRENPRMKMLLAVFVGAAGIYVANALVGL